MKKTALLSLFIFLVSGASFFYATQNAGRQDKKQPLQKEVNDYKKAWVTVDSLDKKGLPKSAYEIVEAIYNKAKRENNSGQIVKAVIHKLKYRSYTEEESTVEAVAELKKEIASAQQPLKQILHSVLAEVYWNYYENNRYRFYNRTETVNFKNNDLRTWDMNKLINEVISHYLESIKNPDTLKKIKVNAYNEVIVKGTASRSLRPTLYDFLAHRTVDFFMNEESGLASPAYKFEIEKDEYFDPAEKFVRINITSKDSLSLKYYALKMLQDILRFHLNDEDPAPFLDADLKRLSMVRSHSTNEIKDSLYLQALRTLYKKHASVPHSGEVAYAISEHLFSQGNEFTPFEKPERQWLTKEAHDLITEVIHKFPGSDGAIKCSHLKAQIEQKSLSITSEKVNIPGKPFRSLVTWKNLSKIYLRIAKVDPEDKRKSHRGIYGDKLLEKFLALPVIQEWELPLPETGDFQVHSAEIKIDALPAGEYMLLAGTDKYFSFKKNAVGYEYINVSNISYLKKTTGNGGYDFYTLHRESGVPLKGVTAQLWFQDYDYKLREYRFTKGESYRSNDSGFFEIPAPTKYRNFEIEFAWYEERLYTGEGFYQYQYAERKPYTSTHTHFFTDRSIYRPGQTIYFKGIVTESTGDKSEIRPGYTSHVTFYDVNSRVVEEKDFTTNEYGTFSGSFTAPQGVLNGQMHIQDSHGSVYFSVEEYKRPKFEVTFTPVTGSYRLGDSVTVKGSAKAYAGSAIDKAQVKYRVVRTSSYQYWWRWYGYNSPGSPEMEIAHDAIATNDTGGFTITFLAVPDRNVKKNSRFRPNFTYHVYADVTDISGETRSSETSVKAGYAALILETEFPESVHREEKPEIKITTTNMSGQPEPAKVTITVRELKQPTRLYRNRLWNRPDLFTVSKPDWSNIFPNDLYGDEDNPEHFEKGEMVFTSGFDSGKEKILKLEKISSWKPGLYEAESVTKDKYGEEVKSVSRFTLYSTQEKTIPENSYGWSTLLKSPVSPGENAQVLIGTRANDVKVLYEIHHHGALLEKKWLALSNEQRMIEFSVTEAHRGGLQINFIFVKDNRSYVFPHTVKVPLIDSKLEFEYMTFRDKLKPGQKEEWKIKIKGKAGEKIAAEMVSAMYDASLDAFKDHNWYFHLPGKYYLSSQSWTSNYSFGIVSTSIHSREWNVYPSPFSRTYDRLNWFNAMYAIAYGGAASYEWDGRGSLAPVSLQEVEMVAADEAATAGAHPGKYKTEEKLSSDTTKAYSVAFIDRNGNSERNGKPTDPNPQARKNLNETAFFFPQLQTNENGEVILSFTMSEALTRWKLMNFAHTKDLKWGMSEREIVTQKELMVMPNAPRFFREGDTINFSTKISNLSDTVLNVTAHLMLFDAITMKALKLASPDQGLVRTVPKGQSSAVFWKLIIPSGIDAITYRVFATAGKFTDGEEAVIPILTNRMLVTESLPIWMRSGQAKIFKLDKLINNSSSTLRHHKLTLEYTSNPAWYAVQSLPYLMEYPYECAEQTFSRYYANSLASFIANSNPKIKAVFDQWRSSGPTGEVLISNLEKNQELKSLLLEETPWVMDAKDESERKKRIALLFDLNKMADELGRVFRRLQKMQTSNGGWPWFEGMPDDRYITQHIVCGFGKLDRLGVKSIKEDAKMKSMIHKAIHYLDKRIKEDYQYLVNSKADLSKNNFGDIEIHYLYTRSFFKEIPVAEGSKKAFDYYTGNAEKYWLSGNKYIQGMIALALYRFGSKNVPADIIKSLKEHSLSSEEMGMYWKENTAGYYWYQAPVETQALLIETFDEVAQDKKSVEEMRIWLLRQKQTQNWRSTKATVEACYALLLRGSDWLSTTPSVQISLGSMLVDPMKMEETKAEAGTGYIKKSWSGNEIEPEMGTVTVTPLDPSKGGISWGALYWQYFEQLDKITPHETPLKLNKKLFVEKNTDRGPVLEPVTDSTLLKPGDRIKVRIELRVDRSMEYVHMKDMRASALEPENVLSQYKYQDGLSYYESTRDAATNFFFPWLAKGTYVFEYPLRVTHAGNFSNGITTIQCMYAPEFTSHSEGIRIQVESK